MDAKDLIFNLLKDSKEPLKSGDITEKTGIDKKIVDKCLKELKEENKITSPKRCFYSAL